MFGFCFRKRGKCWLNPWYIQYASTAKEMVEKRKTGKIKSPWWLKHIFRLCALALFEVAYVALMWSARSSKCAASSFNMRWSAQFHCSLRHWENNRKVHQVVTDRSQHLNLSLSTGTHAHEWPREVKTPFGWEVKRLQESQANPVAFWMGESSHPERLCSSECAWANSYCVCVHMSPSCYSQHIQVTVPGACLGSQTH